MYSLTSFKDAVEELARLCGDPQEEGHESPDGRPTVAKDGSVDLWSNVISEKIDPKQVHKTLMVMGVTGIPKVANRVFYKRYRVPRSVAITLQGISRCEEDIKAKGDEFTQGRDLGAFWSAIQDLDDNLWKPKRKIDERYFHSYGIRQVDRYGDVEISRDGDSTDLFSHRLNPATETKAHKILLLFGVPFKPGKMIEGVLGKMYTVQLDVIRYINRMRKLVRHDHWRETLRIDVMFDNDWEMPEDISEEMLEEWAGTPGYYEVGHPLGLRALQ